MSAVVLPASHRQQQPQQHRPSSQQQQQQHRPPLSAQAQSQAAQQVQQQQQQQQVSSVTPAQLHRLLQGLTSRVNDLTGRVDMGEVQAQGLREEMHRLEVLLAAKADRRWTVQDRFAQQPVPDLTVDEWLAECDVEYWMEELYHGNAEMLASTKPARVLTQVLQAFVDSWRQRMEASAATAATATATALPPPPIRGTMVGKGRILFWFLATNWGAVTAPAAATDTPGAAAGTTSALSVVDGNASMLLHGATEQPSGAARSVARAGAGGGSTMMHRAAHHATAAAAASGAMTWRSTATMDSDVMSEITVDEGVGTPHAGGGGGGAAAATTPARQQQASSPSPPPHVVPLEGMWYRMDARKHWNNIVTVLFQKYVACMDRVIECAPKEYQMALVTGRAKCCTATELRVMRMAFYDALAKVPGAIL